MASKELEPTIALDIPQISQKTSNEKLQELSEQRWKHDGKRRVTFDIINNGKELLVGSNIDWELVLGSIRVQQGGGVQFGEAAIATNDARVIGGLAAATGWSMHDPTVVYLSGACLANIVSDRFEDFKITMRQAAVAYTQKTLSDANLYMDVLDFLLELRDRNRHKGIIKNKVIRLLAKGEIKEAYKILSSRGDLVRTRGEDSSSNTTSSILTPPNPLI